MAAQISVNGNVIDSASPEHRYRDASTSEFIYVNSYGVLSNEQKIALKNIGVDIQEYVSQNTYKCHYKNTDLAPIRNMTFVRTANVFEPSLKSTASLKQMIRNETNHTDYKIDVSVHPDAPQTLQQVAQEISARTGVSLESMSIGSNVIELTIEQDKLNLIETIDSVNRIDEFQENYPQNDVAVGIMTQDRGDASTFGMMWDWNPSYYSGKRQIICVADTGIDTKHKAFAGDKLKKLDPFWMQNMTDGNGHGTHVSGSIIEGVAPGAELIVQAMCYQYATSEGKWPFYIYENDMEKQFKRAREDGAYIHTNSWGLGWPKGATEQPGYEVNATVADKMCWEDIGFTVLAAGGNDGGKNNYKGEVLARAAAKNVITVGNCITTRETNRWKYDPSCMPGDPRAMSPTSSTGPTKSGRIKPDVVTIGTAVLSAASSDMTKEDREDNDYYGGYSNMTDYLYMSGTSMATPHVAACVAVLRQALTEPVNGVTPTAPTAHLLKAMLVNGAVDLQGHLAGDNETVIGPAPNGHQGFGRVNLTNSMRMTKTHFWGTGYVDKYWTQESDGRLSVDNAMWYSGPINTNGLRVFRATLAYPDSPGEETQNKLNLRVRSYFEERHGNMGTKLEWDRLNNVEKVEWHNPPSSTVYIEVFVQGITVPGTKVPFAVCWQSNST